MLVHEIAPDVREPQVIEFVPQLIVPDEVKLVHETAPVVSAFVPDVMGNVDDTLVVSITNLDVPFVDTFNVFVALEYNPVLVFPLKLYDGAVFEPVCEYMGCRLENPVGPKLAVFVPPDATSIILVRLE